MIFWRTPGQYTVYKGIFSVVPATLCVCAHCSCHSEFSKSSTGKPKKSSKISSKSNRSNTPPKNSQNLRKLSPRPADDLKKGSKTSETSKEMSSKTSKETSSKISKEMPSKTSKETSSKISKEMSSKTSKGSQMSRSNPLVSMKLSKNVKISSDRASAASAMKSEKTSQPKTFLETKQAEESKLTETERNKKRLREAALMEKYKDDFVDQPPEVEDDQSDLYLELQSLETTKYGKFLHFALQYMWIVLKVCGKIPFGVQKNPNGDIMFSRDRASIHYLLALLNAFILLVIFFWLTAGILLMFADTAERIPDCPEFSKVLQEFEQIFVLRYLLEILLVWTALCHAMVSSVHLVCQEMQYAALFREWYILSDRCQFRIYYSIRAFILRQYLIIGVTLLVIGMFYILKPYAQWFPPTVYNTCSILGLCMVKLTSPLSTKIHDPENKRIIYDQYAWVGLLLYFLAIINSRLSLIPYMVCCRLLANTGTHFNKRINMALKNEPAEGDLAVRLKRDLLYQDHNAICYLAKKIGRVYSWSLMSYYVLQVVSVLAELIVIGIHRYRDEYNPFKWYNLPNTTYDYLFVGDDSRHKFISHVGHLVLTVTSFLYITYVAINASDKCMIVYEIVRRYGLHKCQNEEERNFIRSMWMSGDSKRKIIISPGAFFDLGRPFILTLLTEILLYYVHILPFRQELSTKTGMQKFEETYAHYKNSPEFTNPNCMVIN
ncbi:unnamed protein product [Allacma fusca]|uniref:Uncharacterized protein n=1 Tax=Allacma fusca TaxID=39272 RepID=A0A8J2JEX0_9HEXA|nr:unnamed protein product [Allacma fusca]